MKRILITSEYKYFQSRIPPKFRQTNMTQLWNYLLQNLKLTVKSKWGFHDDADNDPLQFKWHVHIVLDIW